MTAQPAITPGEIEDFLRETEQMDAQFWIEEGDTEMRGDHNVTETEREMEQQDPGEGSVCPECEDQGLSRWYLDRIDRALTLRSCPACGSHSDAMPPVPQSFRQALGLGPVFGPVAFPATAEGELHRQAHFAAARARQEEEWERPGDADDPPGGWPEGEAVEYADPFGDDAP